MNTQKFYSAKEAQEKLGMTYSALRHQVLMGNLKSITPPGRKQSVYLKDEVDKLARELRIFLTNRDTETSTFSRASKEDMPEIVDISKAIFYTAGNDVTPAEIRISWLEKNPYTFFVVKYENKVVAYASLLPLSPQMIEKLLDDKISPDDITPDDVEDFNSPKHTHLYIMSMGVTPGIDKLEKRTYGSKLISGMLDTFIGLGKQGIIIDSLTARSRLPDGIRLLRHMGFPEVAKSHPGKRSFAMKVSESSTPVIQEYKDALKW
jgi:hypothetical protein